MPPNVGLRQAGHAASLCRRPATGSHLGSRQLSYTSRVKPFLHSYTPRTLYAPRNVRIDVSAKATFMSLPWSRSSKSEAVVNTPASREGWGSSDLANPSAQEPPVASESPMTLSPSSTPAGSDSTVLSGSDVATPLFEQLPDSLLTSTDGITNISEHVGFMREMGLDYGYGVTTSLQWVIEHIHVYTGGPWWATIIIAAASVRLVLLYPSFRSTNEMAKMSAMKPVMDKMKEKTKEYRETGDQAAAMEITKELREAKQVVGLNMSWMYAPMILQGVIGYCSFKLLRAMATLPVPGLETGGFYWLSDLTIPDPLYIMPLAMAGVLHILGRLGGEAGAGAAVNPAMRPAMLYVIPVVFAAVITFFPAALQLSFLTATILGAVQSLVFRQPAFRNATGLAPIIPPGSPVPPTLMGKQAKVQAAKAPKTTGPNKLRVVTPMPYYQAPTVKATVKGVDPSKKVDGTNKESPIKALKSSMREMLKSSQDSLDAWTGTSGKKNKSRSKTFQEKADAYEVKRKREREAGIRG